ncbi:hypothetical protein [Rhodococcoides yunnanense]|uniref:Uncharacterized protein n=1 Tax=Rhodococcoides yunnanense TaxID=278209 RepID=A0ABU4BI84_9NOCA|nr:hypothetical protein [Rhodococcus yunnanensis]MDV6263912.1 hypothetical protein [Rhodococcus yunnanensis]
MNAWRKIGENSSEAVILAVDFDSAARPEARFPAFAARVRPAAELWLTAQPDNAEREFLTAQTYLEFWAKRPPGRVEALVGFCVGCVFLPALADQIERIQGSRPALLLIDPERVVTSSILRDFSNTVGGMAVLTDAEREAAISEARSLCDSAGDDFASAATGVVKLYEATAGIAFDRLGLDDETSEDLMGLFRSYVSYLLAAHTLIPKPTRAAGVALTSAQFRSGAMHATSERSFPVGTESMLDDERVAEAARAFFQGVLR